MELVTKQIIHPLEGMINFIFNNKDIKDHAYKTIDPDYVFDDDYPIGEILEDYYKDDNQQFFYSNGEDHFVISISPDQGDDENTGGMLFKEIVNKYGSARLIPGDFSLTIPRYPEIFIYIAKNVEEALKYFENTDKTLFVEIEHPIGPEGVYLVGEIIDIPDEPITKLPYYYNVILDKYFKEREKRKVMFFKDPPYEFIEKGNDSRWYTEIHMVIIEP